MAHLVTASVGTTREQDGCALLHDGEELILKAYVSPDGRKIRIVLPELANFAQTKIEPDKRMLEFTRDARAAQQETRRT